MSTQQSATSSSGETRVMDAGEVRRALTRIAHEIVERNKGAQIWCSSASCAAARRLPPG
jgi:hypothetical protein